MRRRTALALAAVLALVLVATVAARILEEDPAAAPPAAPPEAAPAAPPPPRPIPVDAPSTTKPPTPENSAPDPATLQGRRRGLARGGLEEEDEEDRDWKAYPADAKGPVVVGVVVKYGEENPECSIALESVEDPAREDPSVLEDLPGGRFRLEGFPPGKYRVRAKGDETLAAYSNALITVDGAVTDAGVIRLRRPGSLAGIVQDLAGEYHSGDVRLFGRHPENLSRTVVGRAKAVGRQGFQLPPHEAGEFLFAFEGDGGWAVVSGKTDADGLAWCVVKPRPWSSVSAAMAPPKGTSPIEKVLRTTVEPVDAPDLGSGSRVVSVEGGGPAGRLTAGKYRVTVKWRFVEGDRREDRDWTGEVTVAEGEAAKVEVPR